jgi:hypothetical protein
MSKIEDYYDISTFSDEHIAMLRLINQLGQGFAERAPENDRGPSFPTKNYQELAEHGFLRLVIPKEHGGFGFSLGEYALIGAEIGKYCASTAITFNMHTSAMLWSRYMYDMPNLTDDERAAFQPMRERQFRRVVEDKAIFSQPISEGGTNWTSEPIKTSAKKVDGGWLLNGFKKFASLAGNCDYYSVVCTEHFKDHAPRHEDCLDFAVPGDAKGLTIVGEWDPLGMRATASNDLIIKDVFVSEDDLMMPRGVFVKTLPHWPTMMAMLSPANMGLAQGIYDFTVGYLRGELPGQPPIDRRIYPTKRVSVGKMFQQLTLMRSNFLRVMMEAQGFPTQQQVMRMYVSQIAVMDGVQELAALAIRTCGGQTMLKTMPLERMYRDSRSGALMLPFTTEIMEDYLSVMTLYDMDEIDHISADNASTRVSMWRPA